ncbi:MAG: hypothetical protein ACYSUD_14480 [Planctomycetota bacterium]|jgi:hypothetical protein
MIFWVDPKTKSLSAYKSFWNPSELELEKYLISTAEEEVPTLNSSVFGETLLLVSNQVRTRARKRADILALDHMGNSVIVELKRRAGSLGVETQALQYLADFSRFKGQAFIKRFLKNSADLEENIYGFLGDEVKTEDINNNSRIILMARSFDPTLFSMGEWLSSRGIAFRCIEYTPIKYDDKRFISFSVAFDRCPEAIYPLSFQSQTRPPGYFWHNIRYARDQWWRHLVKAGQISTGFDNQPGDQGERILKNYVVGDTIVAYAKRHGAVGWGTIRNPSSYRLLEVGCDEDMSSGRQLHRLGIEWKCAAASIADAVGPKELLENYGIFHPRSTCVRIDPKKAKHLIKDMQNNPNMSAK